MPEEQALKSKQRTISPLLGLMIRLSIMVIIRAGQTRGSDSANEIALVVVPVQALGDPRLRWDNEVYSLLSIPPHPQIPIRRTATFARSDVSESGDVA